MATCINLRDLAGRRFRIGWDPAYDPKGIHMKDPWMMTVPGHRGTVYPLGGNLLAVEVDYRPKTASKIAALPGGEAGPGRGRRDDLCFPGRVV
jgi:hypothetical protein